MARLPRLYVPGQPQYVILRALGNQAAFRDDEDYACFVSCLRQAARDNKIPVHGWSLTPDAVQILATPPTEDGLPKMLQAIGRRYVAIFNRRHGRSGTLWEGRYRATVFEADLYFPLAIRMVELAPVTQGLVSAPADWRWSSFRRHAGLGEVDAASDVQIADHAVFWALGNTPFERQHEYLRLVAEPLDPRETAALRESVIKGWVHGSPAFRDSVAGAANRRVTPLQRGRPKGSRPRNDEGAADQVVASASAPPAGSLCP
ncbi:transposase [Burkholderia gladioli]|uniref:transposase n=1 Tax=Burkholderia gladioli TaxID=28095 RepID=UPI001FC88064|nr:transposase [Burkholderia gladioli]